MWLEITLKKAYNVASYYPAEAFLKEVELEIGGQRIDKLYSDWFRIFDELYRSSDEKLAYRKLADFDDTTAAGDAAVEKKMFVPLLFFFNRAPGLALPLVALQVGTLSL